MNVRRVAVLAGLLSCISLAGAQERTRPEPVSEPGVRTTPEADWQGVRVCNRSNDDVQVAKALNENEHDSSGHNIYRSEGWWLVNRGECRILWSGPIRWRYYLVYAEATDGSGSWSGDQWICVSREPFTIKEGTCPEGYNRRRFKVVDTGDVRERYTYTLNP